MIKNVLILLVAIVAFSSCKKKKILEDINGVWHVESLTLDGEDDPRDVSGTYTFNDCSSKENRKGDCTVRQQLLIEFGGASQETDNELVYRVLKKGEMIQLDDSEVEIDIDGDKLTLTFNDEEVTVINLVR